MAHHIRLTLAGIVGLICTTSSALVALAELPTGTPAQAVRAAAPTSKTFAVEDVKLHYLIEGRGEPVVLIHGLNSSAQMNWVLPGIFAALAADHQVIAIDMPGHGQSDRPEGDAAYGTQMVEDVVALLDELKIEKAHIIGYSMGGMITLKLAAMHPERVRSAVLGGMGWLREGSRLQHFWEQVPAREGRRTPPACVRGFAKLAVSEEDLLKIKLPIEVVVGNHDPVERMYVKPLRTVRPNWPVVEIEDAGHISCVMKSAFRDSLVEWLKGHAEQ